MSWLLSFDYPFGVEANTPISSFCQLDVELNQNFFMAKIRNFWRPPGNEILQDLANPNSNLYIDFSNTLKNVGFYQIDSTWNCLEQYGGRH